MNNVQTDIVAQVAPHLDAVTTFDDLLRYHADQRPELPALKDPSNRRAAGLGRLRRLDYWSLNRIVDQVASVFEEHGLTRGDIIAVQLGNIVECPITVLAAMRAGLVPCMVPLLWRGHEIRQVFSKLPVKAIICQGDEPHHSYGAMMRDLAAEFVSVRFVYGAGGNVPDGVMPLNDVFERPVGSELGEGFSKPFEVTSNDPAVILWATDADGVVSPLWRTHEEMIVAGLHQAAVSSLSGDDRVLNPFPIGSVAGLIGMFAPWLIVGCDQVLHEAFEEAAFLKDLSEQDVTYCALPAPLFEKYYRSGTLKSAGPTLRAVGCVWTAPHVDDAEEKESVFIDPALPVFDLSTVGDFVCLISPRDRSRATSSLALGPTHMPVEDGAGPLLLEMKLKGGLQNGEDADGQMTGQLLLRGALVPDAAYTRLHRVGVVPNGDDGWLYTGVLAHMVGDEFGAVKIEADPRFIYYGGLSVWADDLDEIYSAFGNVRDAAAFTISDPLVGERIFAAIVPPPDQSPSVEEFEAYLADKSVAPYKVPEKLVVVSVIPRDEQGRVKRSAILDQL